MYVGWRARVLTSMELTLLCHRNQPGTQREVYYSFPNHFANQSQCNDAILDCASLLGVDRERLNLRASSRGLYSGVIRLWEPGLGTVDGTTVVDPQSISSHWITNSTMNVDVSRARFILVVEKEGIFGRLVEDKFWRRLPCVIITGRGFPDLATRAMVHQLSKRFSLPCYVSMVRVHCGRVVIRFDIHLTRLLSSNLLQFHLRASPTVTPLGWLCSSHTSLAVHVWALNLHVTSGGWV